MELLLDGASTKIMLTPQGETFNQGIADDLLKKARLMIICIHGMNDLTGGDDSLPDESFVNRMVEYPQYSRPAEFR